MLKSSFVKKEQAIYAQIKMKDVYIYDEVLKEIVEVTKEAYRYYNKSDNLYNDMLDDYEEGFEILHRPFSAFAASSD